MENDYALLITLGLLLILSPVVKNLVERVGIPAPVGYIGLGLLISALDTQWPFVGAGTEQTFALLAQLGVVALLFRVGLRSHLKALIDKLPDASLVWAGDVSANLILCFALSHYGLGLSIQTSLAIATAFSATSVAVSVSVWDELKMLNTSRGTLLVDVAELDDLSGVILFAILLSIIPVLESGQSQVLSLVGITTLSTILKLVLFIAICYLFSHYFEERFTRFNREMGASGTTLIITILGSGLVISALAGQLGFSLAIGALFAGLAFSRDPKVVRNEGKFEYFYEFFAPFFFINIGLQVDPEVFFDSTLTGLLIFIVAVAGKLIGVALPASLSVGKADAIVLGISMVPRAEIALLVIYQCSELGEGLMPPELYAGAVTAALLTCILAPPVLRLLLLRQSRRH